MAAVVGAADYHAAPCGIGVYTDAVILNPRYAVAVLYISNIIPPPFTSHHKLTP